MTETDMMGVQRGRHLTPTQIRPAGPSPDDHWPVCRRSIRVTHGPRKGELVRDAEGKPKCFCDCVDGTGRHRWDHEDLAHNGTCFWCGERL